jgi:hypothetical protein
MDWIDIVLAIFTTLFTVCGMQFKNMNYILASQLASNTLLMLQYLFKGGISAAGVVIVAIVQTVISFVLSRMNKDFPVWLTGIFMIAFAVVTAIYYKNALDLITCAAVWCFAIAIVQKRSWICRAFSALNVSLWLVYDILSTTYSAVVTHAVIIVFIAVGIIRLDLGEWKSFLSRIFGKKNTEK